MVDECYTNCNHHLLNCTRPMLDMLYLKYHKKSAFGTPRARTEVVWAKNTSLSGEGT